MKPKARLAKGLMFKISVETSEREVRLEVRIEYEGRKRWIVPLVLFCRRLFSQRRYMEQQAPSRLLQVYQVGLSNKVLCGNCIMTNILTNTHAGSVVAAASTAPDIPKSHSWKRSFRYSPW